MKTKNKTSNKVAKPIQKNKRVVSKNLKDYYKKVMIPDFINNKSGLSKI